jgi:hypothetical protein
MREKRKREQLEVVPTNRKINFFTPERAVVSALNENSESRAKPDTEAGHEGGL